MGEAHVPPGKAPIAGPWYVAIGVGKDVQDRRNGRY